MVARGADLKGGAESSSVLEEKLYSFHFETSEAKRAIERCCISWEVLCFAILLKQINRLVVLCFGVRVCACMQAREIRGESATTYIVALRWCVLCRAGKIIWVTSSCCVDQPLTVQSSQVLWLRGRDCQRSGKSIQLFLRLYLCNIM